MASKWTYLFSHLLMDAFFGRRMITVTVNTHTNSLWDKLVGFGFKYFGSGSVFRLTLV